MNDQIGASAANDDDFEAPAKALAMYRAYWANRSKDPLSIHFTWTDEFLEFISLAVKEEPLTPLPTTLRF